MSSTMTGAFLPGNNTATLRQVPVPQPSHGEILVRMKVSTICGSDIRCIYREHLGRGPEKYQNVIAGHEPCGEVAMTGPGCRRFREGDRVIVYHISGCGLCHDCRRGYMISCTSEKFRRAYGWQRDGGMAEFLLAEEKDLVLLPGALSYADGAQVACGFATAYEGVKKIGINGSDSILITGLGPMGLAAAALSRKLGAHWIIGTDPSEDRRKLASQLRLFDSVLAAGEASADGIRQQIRGGVSASIDCSGNAEARSMAIRSAGKWGRVLFLGEGGTVSFSPSDDLIHEQKRIQGSWVSSLWRMEELVDLLVDWKLHPEMLITHRFPLEQAGEAYALMASGRCGKVAVCFDEALSQG